jgi:parallel beta-helix repeat protein
MNRSTFVLLLLVTATYMPAGAAKTLHVSSNGLDGSTCGSEERACRSIGQAIDNAAEGDDVVVGAGEYGSREIGSPPFAIVVNKELSITSEEGAAATVINVRDTGRWPVKIFASHVTFGRPGHGFTLSANSVAPFSGISVDEIASDVTVEGNIVTGFGRGIDVAGSNSVIKHNIATGNGEGLNIHGNRNTAAENVSIANFGGGGILVGGTGQIIRQNICNANTFTGIRVAEGTNHQVRRNSAIGNGNEGVSLDFPARATVTRNNLFGTSSNCGLKNNNNVGIVATENFWGAASGPGEDPADDVCNLGVATTATSGFLRKEVRVSAQPGQGRRWEKGQDEGS